MTDRNRIKHHLRQQARRQRQLRQRRGVLLLVVLSMLVLFMLVGTTFLLTSKHGAEAAKNAGREHQYENQPSDLMERAIKQIVRDTQNPFSVLRNHSLLRDMYGSDGFIMPASTNPLFVTAEYAGADVNVPLGLTKGQLVDIIVRPNTNVNPPVVPPTIRLERDANGATVPYTLSKTTGYYNGALLTFLSGAASGRTVRIIDFAFDMSDPTNVFWRFRVMSCGRGDGSPLYLPPLEANLVGDLTGVSFLVNGRPFNGTGAGYNSFALQGGPRLSALEGIRDSAGNIVDLAPIALTPNSVHFRPYLNSADPIGTYNLFYHDASNNPLLLRDPLALSNPLYLPHFVPHDPAREAAKPYYSITHVGPGDVDESYDAPDFQNMFLAWLSASPRAHGMVMDTAGSIGAANLTYDALDPSVQSLYQQLDGCRLMIDDLPLPSFHRPDLAYFWFVRMYNAPWLSSLAPAERTQAILQPYDANGNPRGSAQIAAQITALKRKFMLRPLRDDHPNFDGSNVASRYAGNGPFVPWEVVGPWDVDNDNDGIPDSIWVDLGDPIQETDDGRLYRPLYAFLIIDLDSKLNLNAHGTSEHLVNVPLDNVLVTTVNDQNLPDSGNLAGGAGNPLISSNNLAPGSGWGPADISLRPVLSPNLPAAMIGDRRTDDYARLLTGRPNVRLDINWNPIPDSNVTWGRHGGGEISGVPNIRPGVPLDIVPSNDPITSRNRFLATRDPRTPYDFSDYPVFDAEWSKRTIASLPPANPIRIYLEWAIQSHHPTSFGTSPDLRARYAVGLDYIGQPVYECAYEPTFATIVDDSPYELNLTDEFRNDWVADSLSMVASYSTPSPINDDAPFSIAELERILRANDADMGGVPDRLWNIVNAFDPVKLAATPQYLINFSEPTARLAQAQIEASTNRRLVTTESSHVPAPTTNWYTRCLLGADGKPGLPGVNDDNDQDVQGNPLIDEGDEVNLATFADGCDDYAIVMGATPPTGATIVDYARYRIFLELRRQAFRQDQSSPLANLQLDFPGSDPVLVAQVTAQVNDILGQLMPPDVMAGLKMDLNRPFGDGRDNNGNGVVDEPLEAGEPFVDRNGNRVWDAGEPFLDLDGDGRYYADLNGDGIIAGNPAIDNNDDWADFDGNGIEEPVVDNLWAQQLGSPLPFSHNAGFRGVIVRDINDNPIGELINPYDMVRQLYARHLYILARLTMDENYVAPYDEDNLQLRTWMDKLKDELTTPPANLSPEEAELLIRKKLTYREVAQWAINCADMRDSDVIMTPFEYDENPWDGWNVFDYDNNLAIPLDGDLRTDEDLTFVQAVTTGNNARIIAPRQLSTVEINPVYKTRGVVWGAERPELLITETLGLHDRRTEDLTPADLKGHATVNALPDNDRYKDRTLDQRQPPRGSLFVEVLNPWSSDGQRPVELYSIHARNPDGTLVQNQAGTAPLPPQPSIGVELGRVSDGFWRDRNNNDMEKHSPVWRLIVVEEHPEYRNDDELDDLRADGEDRSELVIPNGPTIFRYTDPDFPGFDYSAMPAKIGTANRNGVFEYAPPKVETWEYQRNQFGLPYPFVEREFYFTAGGSRTIDDIDPDRNSARYRLTSSRYDVADGQFRLRIPNRSIDYTLAGGGGTVRAQTQKFLHPDAERPVDWDDPDDNNWQWQIAPILPGSYGVIGSAGARYNDATLPQDLRDSFVTTLGRLEIEEGSNAITRFRPQMARRIELRVGRSNPQLLDLRNRNPAANQLFVLNNGGKPNAIRDNELLAGTTHDGRFGPAVGIPVEGMNISEPAWEYQARVSENTQRESSVGAGRAALVFNRHLAKGEGAYARGRRGNANADSFDEPFDDAPELVRTGTTLNYRMVHLQRLANPLLPWNPAPGEFTRLDRDGVTRIDAHEPELPINPYRTIDSSSSDLTAFNGISSLERSQPQGAGEPDTRPPNQLRPWLTNESGQFSRNPHQRWIWRTHERGAWAALRTLIGPAADSLPVRAIWQQEPAKVSVLPEYFLDLTPWLPPANPEAQSRQDRKITMTGQQARNAGYDDGNMKMHVDMILEHTLGFGNEAMGDIYSTEPNPAHLQAPIPSALGAPANDTILASASTYPWLAWNNRPYSSDMELLQIPSRSSSEMLRNYTVTNAYADVDAYDGNIPDPLAPALTPEEINDQRDANHHGHFGHLMNFLESAAFPADLQRAPDGTPILDTTDAANPEYVPLGAPHYYRLLDYVHVPSKFVGTDTMLNPSVFNRLGEDLTPNTIDDVLLPNDPRQSLLTPFNQVAKYREPGRVNVNTISDARVWDGGVMHRQPVNPALPYDPITNPYLPMAGHLGLPFHAYSFAGNTVPGLADVRRGYMVNGALPPLVGWGSPPNFDPMYFLDPQYPTIFANPFRSGDAGDLVPLANMMMQTAPTDPMLKGGVHATMLRGTGVVNPVTMLPTTEVSFSDQSPQASTPHFDISRNPYLKYSALNKTGSSATTRSNVFAVWVTVGFFEVEPVSEEIRNRYDMTDPIQRDLFNRIYPEGYMLAQEIGSDTGDIKRHRGFYIIDRSLPAGFMPGVDVNVDDLIKLRRRIE